MKNIISLKLILFLICGAVIFLPRGDIRADENLSLYGLRGYAYTYSPLPSGGLQMQTGVMYSMYGDSKLECREGNIWVVPLSLTYGDGDWWEVSAATHWERWENTDDFWDEQGIDASENGLGDVFAGGKLRFLGQDRGSGLDASLMAYMLIPTGNRDKSIGDLYLYNPTDDDDFSYGINALFGRRWGRVYLALNIGMNYVDTDIEHIEESTFFGGAALEYQISETATSYLEYLDNENKNRENYPSGDPCYDENTDDNIREIGAGFVWLKDRMGVKLHVGAGLSDTAPTIRTAALFNWSF